MWDLPGPALEPVSPALAGGFLTTASPGKSCFCISSWEERLERESKLGREGLLAKEGPGKALFSGQREAHVRTAH